MPATNVLTGGFSSDGRLVEPSGTWAEGKAVLQVLDLTGRVVKSVDLRTFSQHLCVGTPDGPAPRVLKQAL